MTSKLEGVRVVSGSPELSRWLVQKCLNYCALWPVETRWARQEFAWCCSAIRVQLVVDPNGIWLEPIKFKEDYEDCIRNQ